jgi:tetratricopeptide (TPR) repeat protein
LAAGLRRFPNDAGLLIEAARLAHNAGLVEVALDAWADVRNRFPDAAPGWLEAAEILVRERRFDAAERLLVEALRAVPGDPAVYRACADLAEARGEPIQADLIRLDIASLTPNQGSPEARPRDATGWSGSGVPLAETGDPASLRDLALAFESLGGTGPSGGCEFGAVQNAWGADPLGLLRWAAVTPASLVAALTARFAGIEDVTPENLFLNPDDPRDLWWIREPRYDIVMHGFLPAHEASRERAAEVSRRRLRYLRDKLVRDLESPEKTFVFKLSTRHLTDEEIIRIDAALRAVGPAELLCVCAADPDHSAGALERRAPGLWVGYLDYSDQWANEPRRPGWRTLCEAVVRGRRPG